ncbi:hypothetical protein BpHYR1_001085 [Brachionus plicatilis]|uniref:Uncharacterized protein n=1 Tax=Brachionus plicatilis TaxID=10195 RepID=A0A3M7S6E1_BRAPC|nr:hypothetical protein BpHYR1_001085 [Brachionus plicatilis]
MGNYASFLLFLLRKSYLNICQDLVELINSLIIQNLARPCLIFNSRQSFRIFLKYLDSDY